MKLDEIFQPGGKGVLPWTLKSKHEHDIIYEFFISEDQRYLVYFSERLYYPGADEVFEIEFEFVDQGGISRYGVLDMGTGIAVKVFATVHDIVRHFIKTNPSVETLIFSAKEPSRQKLYHRFAQALDPNYRQKKYDDDLHYIIDLKK